MRRGFSLVEVLIVVLILGILTTLVMPQFAAMKERVRVAEALINISAVKQAVELYRCENSSWPTTAARTADELRTATRLDTDIEDGDWVYRYVLNLNIFPTSPADAEWMILAIRDASGTQYNRLGIGLYSTGEWYGDRNTHPHTPKG
ncbi:MAG: prepilin-type N-terminal cleavage/methylation domain-containing protein [Candidatus Omnitrophica bacterium]|nr:prepilin-type N-terminal cleavage/methylation domain-containing protein [Candidatus Omnitrophota bacterium]